MLFEYYYRQDAIIGHLTLELSSTELEIPNDAYTTLSRNLIGCSTLSQEYCKMIGFYWKIINETASSNINMPYWVKTFMTAQVF